jgi:cyclic pyranopterin phosphate synthase
MVPVHGESNSGNAAAPFRDSFNRTIDYLRISITDRCNLRCIYCMPEKGRTCYPGADILTSDEIIRVVRIAAAHGVRKVRLTGGEPLLRGDILSLVRRIKSVGISDLSITTNGQRLACIARELKTAGLDRVNISLDTLNAERYRLITRGGDIEHVWAAVREAERVGLAPIKINVVPIRGVNDDEVKKIAGLTMYMNVHVRFIEFMPVSENRYWNNDAYLRKEEIMERVAEAGSLIPREFRGGGPSRNYMYDGALGVIGFVSALSDCFCASCNRLRLTSIGRLRPCLFSPQEVDMRTPLRSGASDEELELLYRQAVLSKPARHAFRENAGGSADISAMSRIGG